LSFNSLYHIHRIEVWLCIGTLIICKTISNLMRCHSFLFIHSLNLWLLIILNIFLNLILKLSLMKLIKLLNILNNLGFLIRVNCFQAIAQNALGNVLIVKFLLLLCYWFRLVLLNLFCFIIRILCIIGCATYLLQAQYLSVDWVLFKNFFLINILIALLH